MKLRILAVAAVAALLPLLTGGHVARASSGTNVGVVGFAGFGDDPDYRGAIFGRGKLDLTLNFFVTNGPADNVVLTDKLPAGVTYVSDNLGEFHFPGAVYDRGTNTVTWNLGTISSGPGEPMELIVQTDPGVADGAILTNTLSISTSTPQTTTADDSTSDDFQVGYLPLQISEQTSYACDAKAQGATKDSRSVQNDAPVACAATGVGQATASTYGPNSPTAGQIVGANDAFTLDGVGVSGYADGAFDCVSSVTCQQGNNAHADATSEVRVLVSNPNPYSIRLHTVTDTLVWATHGNECTTPKYPGDASVEAFRNVDASGCVYSQLERIHLDDCRFSSCATIHSEETDWPDTSGPDPELDPAGTAQVADQVGPPDGDPCSNGTFVGAGAQNQTIAFLGFDDATANGSTTVTTGAFTLIRSGYGRFSATESFQVTRCDAPVNPAPVALVIQAHSPVDLQVTDAKGRKIGFDAASKRVVDDLPGAAYTGHGSEPQTVMIANPSQSTYDIEAVGTGTGSYTIDAETIDGNGNVIKAVELHGTATPGSHDEQQVSLAPGGNLGSGGDTTPPVISQHDDVVAEATGPSGASVTYALPSASDPDDAVASLLCDPASGSTFALGTTTVTCTATDTHGNSATSTFAVTVRDSTPPAITVPANPNVDATSPQGAKVAYAVSASDLVDGPVGVSCTPASGSVFPIGTTTVTCSALDSHGNKAQASFSVHVEGAGEQLGDLSAYVAGNQLGPGTSLAAKLQTASAALKAGDVAGACGALKALINETSAQSGKKLTAAQADGVIAAATRIRAVLGC
jgi:hypothetical protein